MLTIFGNRVMDSWELLHEEVERGVGGFGSLALKLKHFGVERLTSSIKMVHLPNSFVSV